MSDYTPSLADGQNYYVAGRAHTRRQSTGEQALDITPYSREFSRMIAQVRAETLREAAEEAEEWKAADGMHGGEWFPSEWAGQVAGWLEHRAARNREQP